MYRDKKIALVIPIESYPGSGERIINYFGEDILKRLFESGKLKDDQREEHSLDKQTGLWGAK